MSLVNLNLSLNTDRAVNKIAFCSAVVAGFAYVGYSVCRNAFSRRRRGRNDDTSPRRSVFLRRLSQTTQTDGLLGEFLPGDDSLKIIIKQKSVQERIRDLNMQARQFSNAVTAIQTGGNCRTSGVSGRSLQVTPWGSPRLLSPVDVHHHFVPEYPEGNMNPRFSPGSSPSRRSWSRTGSFKGHKVDFDVTQDVKLKDCEQFWLDERERIIQQLPDLLGNSQRELDVDEARSLVAVLASNETPLILGALSVVANLAAFTNNQETLREGGLLAVIPKLILNSSRPIKLKACVLAANMAINQKNNHDMRSVAVVLTQVIRGTPLNDPGLLSSAITALTNIAVLPTWHEEIKPVFHKIYSLLDEGHWNSDGVSFQSLRLLINLSCNEDMVPSLLAAQAPVKLIYMLDMTVPEEVIMRILTLLANIAEVTKRMKIDPLQLPAENKAAAPDTMYAAVFGVSMVERFKKKALMLAERHANSDVCNQARKLHSALSE